MKTSTCGVQVLHYFETCRLTAYPDPGSKDGKPWTIGWGHTGPDVYPGLIWTREQADAAFVADLGRFERDVMQLVKVPVNQGHFDALVTCATLACLCASLKAIWLIASAKQGATKSAGR
ncbi:lysozyme [Polaromonas sp.]|jgi:lysozyme|uniref:lysozyme n=1 Tax=Polaromonas sp. TaxID=1869339 RepID=UPI0037C5FE0F